MLAGFAQGGTRGVERTQDVDPFPSWLVKASGEALPLLSETKTVSASLRDDRMLAVLKETLRWLLLNKLLLDVDDLYHYREGAWPSA